MAETALYSACVETWIAAAVNALDAKLDSHDVQLTQSPQSQDQHQAPQQPQSATMATVAKALPAVAPLQVRDIDSWEAAREWILEVTGDAPRTAPKFAQMVIEVASEMNGKTQLDSEAIGFITSSTAVHGPLTSLATRLYTYWHAESNLAIYRQSRPKGLGGPKP
eukprot:5716903-Karenia_brevis.AAC.1